MKQKKRRGCGLGLIIILCAVLAVLIFFSVKKVLEKLAHYGESTTVQSEEISEAEDASEQDTIDPEDAAEEEEDPLPKNTYDADGFYEENGLLQYDHEGVIGVPGIDVSAHQTEIDWPAVKEAGVEFAMIRVGYRGYGTGKLDLDDYFLRNMEGALNAGLDVGVYFFSQALTPEEAVEEAEYVLNWIEGYDIRYPVVFDWEEVEDTARTDDMNMLMLTSCAEAFCRTIEEAGYTASIYFNQVYGYTQLNLVSLMEYDFWLAEYAETPTFVYDFQMWQYTNEGTVSGISGPVDLNIYFKK